jgi:hypothetical protein
MLGYYHQSFRTKFKFLANYTHYIIYNYRRQEMLTIMVIFAILLNQAEIWLARTLKGKK